ncbi:preprotein translocase subunit SecY [candidate division WOR-1 bacterium RIFOXYA12_FULL_43_27]|uniref:Protein translocase subunit SecY n=1 Tax=candidate division WOR-1 bacterium RIFOXYC2_FULL_46_14 TaxID=1802587 RepID=A0A1F4U5P1_UNCSA|nr:MAG: preprotein translocase subunit SecY [candidate division WOR-1 bacterium RIFOXYA12_FULL_43_27]OGC20429.1 MAG: preprotein translocase subunit SecY [candidate division WOR-1 bacterium RIFOXYB2_FULL_46_45]OGC31834.1 MAG: preprotein translocase subunit SecY [candidate division WOR-1 bacterium RIFOXYA2_FULL_46_56]OGC40274.1 MAG: preprotein translocase subunit SecY [candidate division WOR-1 bacterium RIFOXYC2_FULL_46_14]
MLNVFRAFFTIPDLKKKILFTVAMILVFRFGAHVPVPGVDASKLAALFSKGSLVGFLDMFTGGALMRFSVFAMGIVPYINASIIMQLLTIVIPTLEQLSKEGEAGRKQISQYTRYLSICLAAFQSFGMAFWMRGVVQPGINFPLFVFLTVVSLTAGSTLVMWIGELITERGLGNGASMLIFVGIIARLPSYIANTYTLVVGGASLIGVIFLLLSFIVLIVAIVFIQEGQRKIPVQYAKRVVGRKMLGGGNTFIPLKINQGGVIPIIFASSVLLFPATIAQFVPLPFMKAISDFLAPGGWFYMVLYFALIFFFTYFYTAITFNPTELANNIKKYGGFILGIRPGKPTADFLDFTISRLTFVGALFLATIALIPTIVEGVTKITSFQGLGSTALLIVVGVALDLVRQVETHLVTRQYEGLLA